MEFVFEKQDMNDRSKRNARLLFGNHMTRPVVQNTRFDEGWKYLHSAVIAPQRTERLNIEEVESLLRTQCIYIGFVLDLSTSCDLTVARGLRGVSLDKAFPRAGNRQGCRNS
jgi:hypothetical protein